MGEASCRTHALVGRRSGGAASNAERRHSCRRGPGLHEQADKNVGAPRWKRLRQSVALPAHGFGKKPSLSAILIMALATPAG